MPPYMYSDDAVPATRAALAAEAARLLLIPVSSLSDVFLGMDGTVAFTSFSSGGGSIGVHATMPSCSFAQSGAGAGDQGFACLTGTPLIVPGGTSGEWFVAARFRLDSVVTAPTDIGALACNNELFFMGANGSFSTTKFCCAATTGGAILSTVNIDLAWHTMYWWRRAGVSYFSVDGEAPVAGNNYGAGPQALSYYARNGGTAANRRIIVDYQFAGYPLPTA